MKINSPSLPELHAFLAVQRTGSFRKAAEELCVTQGAVSRAVLRLEETLGQAVFTRAATGVMLTPFGELLRQGVEKPVADLEAASQRLCRRPDRLKLRVSVLVSLSVLWLMPRLADFRQKHPEVDLELQRHHHSDDAFARDDVDLWVVGRRSATQPWPRQISAQYLIGKEIVAVCSPALAARVRSAQSLLTLPLLYLSGFSGNWLLWAQEIGASLPDDWSGTGFDLNINMLEAAREGMGVAVVQKCLVEPDIQAGRLVIPVAGEASTGRGYFLCRRRSQEQHVAAQLFSKWIAEQAKQQVHQPR